MIASMLGISINTYYSASLCVVLLIPATIYILSSIASKLEWKTPRLFFRATPTAVSQNMAF